MQDSSDPGIPGYISKSLENVKVETPQLKGFNKVSDIYIPISLFNELSSFEFVCIPGKREGLWMGFYCWLRLMILSRTYGT
jgi:hypothetical protein